MKSKVQKKKELAELKDKLSKSKITIFTSFARAGEKGLKVTDIQALKKDLRAADSEYVVEKKTLLDKALVEDKKGDIDVFQYEGSLGVVFGYGEETAIAKSVYTFARKNPALKYFGALWNGKFMDLAEFTEFAKLPTREVMIARFLGMLNYPLSGLAAVLNQIALKKGPSADSGPVGEAAAN
jgi:large subunit ribosomal protein L10